MILNRHSIKKYISIMFMAVMLIVITIISFIILPYSVYYMILFIIESYKMNKSILIIVLSTVFILFLILSIIGCISQIKTIVDELRELIHPGKLTKKRLKKSMLIRYLESNKSIK